jgi:tetratricopeptide (TPR) repeat protein
MDKRKRKKILIISGAALLVILIVVGILLYVKKDNPEEEDSAILTEAEIRRENTLRLAASYAEVGEYERALNLLDGLLIENHMDEDAKTLQRSILTANRSGNTDALLEAQLRFLEEQRQQNAALAANAANMAFNASAANAAFNANNARQQSSSNFEDDSAAMRRAAVEAEEARRKQQEEELAKASRQMQEVMRRVNNLVADGTARLAAGDLDGASRLFSEARSVMPPGENHFEAQKLSDMADAYYNYRINNPNAPGAQSALTSATQLANEAIGKDPSVALPHYILGKIARDANQTDRAITEFREASRLDANNFIYAHDLGRSLFLSRRYQEAREAFQNVVRINPNFETGWYNLGGTLRILNRQNEALEAYKQAVAIKDDYAAAHREIGRILQATGDSKGAINAFSKALQYSNDFPTLCELAAAHGHAGNFVEAESIFARALQINSKDAQTNYNMAVVKLELRKYDEALSFAKNAVDNSPANAIYIYTMGLACEKMGAPELAINSYQRSISLDPKYMRPRINLGSIYLSSGKYDDAIACLSEAYTIEPANFEVNNNLGAVYAKKENWSYSIVHYERALTSNPNDPTVRFNLARAYAGAGEIEKAQSSYQALLRIAPDNWDAMFELGMTCVTLGQNNEAKRYLQDLISRNPNYSGKAEAERILRSL